MSKVLESRSKTVGEYTYDVIELDALTGRKVFLRISKVAAQAFKGENLGDAIAVTLAELKEDDFEFLCDLFAQRTTVKMPDGREPKLSEIFSLHFAGKYYDMLVWLAFCLEVNFSDFFSKAAGVIGKLKQKGAVAELGKIEIPAKPQSP